jgi:mono/diheme cytochrome c family protein/uncharacterized membrane protein
MPDIPDFTMPSWQQKRSDAKLLVSILDGKSQNMPSFRGKLHQDQARELVAHVRAFAAPTGKPGAEKRKEPAPPSDFEKEFRRLEEEIDELKRQLRQVREVPADRKPSKPSKSPASADSSEPSESRPHASPQTSAPPPTGTSADRELFGQHCVKCHGADGTGSEARRRQPKIPNFTDTSWQARHSDAQLLSSILNGNGKAKEMPPWRGRISEEQARQLVGHIRAFAPDAESPSQEEREKPAPAEAGEYEKPIAVEAAEAKPLPDFTGKLIPWLGRFHPFAVHFPVALLTAAAVAELLRLATDKPAFDAASRFCIAFGAFAAVTAAVFGWFAGGFRLTDTSWVLMTHRWLGTSTVACAVLVWVLSEASQRPNRPRTRTWLRATLLVVAVLVLVTGFFGGAVVFSLDHHSWPP